MRRYALLLVLAFISAPALAVFKCEFEGKTSYSDAPCNAGKAINLQVAHPNESEFAEAKKQATREKIEARDLEYARRKRENAEEKVQARIAKADAARRKKCQSLAMRRKWSEEDAAAASGKSFDKARRRAQRKAEQYEAECGK